mmetsp:Transcript_32251/g.99409  ORF Transcript_32251/g.99409 Transcript_32251/m.99409 type:complete len:189 (-) Transcript_32251:13-579(-)
MLFGKTAPLAFFSTLEADIAANPTVFGALLRREQPVRVLYEDETLFAFRNIHPYAPLAGLVIPKRRMRQDPDNLGASDLDLVKALRRVALEVCEREQPAAFAKGDYWLRFHRRPFNSVDHLHLHVLAPASAASSWTSFVFMTGMLHASSVDAVIRRLEKKKLRAAGGDLAPKNGTGTCFCARQSSDDG